MLSQLRLQATQAVCASEDIAQSLQEAEALLDAHSEVKVSLISFFFICKTPSLVIEGS